MESLYKYVSILLRKAFHYYLQFEKKTKGECSNLLVNPTCPTFKIYPQSDQFSSQPPLALWCRPSSSPTWFPQQLHHISLFCPHGSFLVILQTGIVILVELARSHQSNMFKAPKGLQTCIIRPHAIWPHHSGTFPSHTPWVTHSGLAGPQISQASLMLTSSSPSYLLTCTFSKGSTLITWLNLWPGYPSTPTPSLVSPFHLLYLSILYLSCLWSVFCLSA